LMTKEDSILESLQRLGHWKIYLEIYKLI